jgi:hypothetical protein
MPSSWNSPEAKPIFEEIPAAKPIFEEIPAAKPIFEEMPEAAKLISGNAHGFFRLSHPLAACKNPPRKSRGDRPWMFAPPLPFRQENRLRS